MSNFVRNGIVALAAFAFFANAELCFAALSLPLAPQSYILDQANVLSPETESAIQQEIALLNQETSTQIAVVTVSSLQDYAIEDYAIALARSWGIGQQGSDNGVLLLIAPTERKVRIEVGYGLEGVIPDAEAWRIIDDVMTPSLHANNYDAAVLNGVVALNSLARGETFAQIEKGNNVLPALLNTFGPFALIFLFLIGRWLGSTKSWWLGGVLGAGVGVLVAGLLGLGIGVAAGLLIDFILSKLLHGKNFNSPGFWWLGGGRGGSSGGGSSFGGFGGGSFGGGGSSGSF